jgi:hypothetical protein
MAGKHAFRFTVLGRYPARLKGNQTAVTVNVAAGEPGHPVHCGTLTMSEEEWESLEGALRTGLKDALEVQDHDLPDPDSLQP